MSSDLDRFIGKTAQWEVPSGREDETKLVSGIVKGVLPPNGDAFFAIGNILRESKSREIPSRSMMRFPLNDISGRYRIIVERNGKYYAPYAGDIRII